MNFSFRIFIKEPKLRPSATEILKAPFVIRHREVDFPFSFSKYAFFSLCFTQRTKLTGPLESTIAGKSRSREVNNRLYVVIQRFFFFRCINKIKFILDKLQSIMVK